MKNTHGGVLLLVKVQASENNFAKCINHLWKFFIFLTLSWQRYLSYRHQAIDLLCKSMDSLICSANQWTGFYMIETSVMKELNCTNGTKSCKVSPRRTTKQVLTFTFRSYQPYVLQKIDWCKNLGHKNNSGRVWI